MEKQTIGDRLRQIRNENCLTIKQAAERLMIKSDSWSSWENGDRVPSVPSLIDICETFNVSADWLLGQSERRKK